MGFTAVLAFATVGLGVANAFLYATGEKQFRFAIRAAKAAEDSTVIAREIGESQVRAYLACEGATYTIYKSVVSCEVMVRNHGQSPAIWTEITAGLVTAVGTKYVRSKTFTGDGPAIAAGQVGKITAIFLHEDMGEGAHDALWKHGAELDVRGRVNWRDVFGKLTVRSFFLTHRATIPPPSFQRRFEAENDSLQCSKRLQIKRPKPLFLTHASFIPFKNERHHVEKPTCGFQIPRCGVCAIIPKKPP